MDTPIGTDKGERSAAGLFDIAIGEALFASTLATVLLTNQVASGRISHEEAGTLLDGAALVLERYRGTDALNTVAVDYARDRVGGLMKLLQQLRAREPA